MSTSQQARGGAGGAPPAGSARNRHGRRRRSGRPRLEELEGRCAPAGVPLLVEVEPNQTPETAQLIPVIAEVKGAIASTGDVDWYRLKVTATGLVRGQVGPAPGSGLDPRLTLFAAGGRELVTSDDLAPGSPTAAVGQHVVPGDYYFRVVAQQGTASPDIGGYRLGVDFDPTEGVGPTFRVGFNPVAPQLVDLNGDGSLDLVTVNNSNWWLDGNVSVLLGNGDGTFQPQRRFTVGGMPTELVAADVNGDGRTDFVLGNSYSRDVSVLLGNGDGTFQGQRRVAAGSYQWVVDTERALAVADVSRDGKLDLLTLEGGAVSVFLGNGNGTFQPRQRLAAGNLPVSLAVTDLNRDGVADLVTADASTGGSVLLGNGDGTFQSERPLATLGGTRSLAVADVNGDGRRDLVLSRSGLPGLSVLLGNGDGTFRPQLLHNLRHWPRAPVVSDVTGDGRVDLVIADATGRPTVSVLVGSGDGTFGPPRDLGVGPNPASVTVADANGDGRPDLIALNGDDSVSVLAGDGGGAFQSERRFVAWDAQRVGWSYRPALVAADVNRDGSLDLTVASTATFSGDGTALVLLGNGDGTFRERRRTTVGDTPAAFVMTDANADGRLDLVTANADGNDVSVLLGNGDGTFQQERRFAVGVRPSLVRSVDINDDGRFDLLTANANGGDVSVLLGNGDGTFQVQRRLPVLAFPRELVEVADVTGDGRLDLVTADPNSGAVSVVPGNGDGTFQGERRTSLGAGNRRGWVVTDVNHDGRPDLVNLVTIPGIWTWDCEVSLGRGDGTFEAPARFAAGSDELTVVDIDGDGHRDVLTLNGGGGAVSVLAGNGDGTFRPQRQYEVGRDPRSLVAADVNGDGRRDLIARVNPLNPFTYQASVLVQNADGTFRAPRAYGSWQPSGSGGPGGLTLTVADVTGDGQPDLLAGYYLLSGSSWNSTVSVLAGNGDGTFQAKRDFAVGDVPVRPLTADLNRDGRLDVLTVGTRSEDVSVLLGQGGGSFFTALPERTVEVRHTPQRGDLDRDGVADLVVLDGSGQILFRRGLPGTSNRFAPPLLVNPGRPARDLTLVPTPAGRAAAATDTQGDAVSVYTFAGGGFSLSHISQVGHLPQRIAAADLTGAGLGDLVVTNTLDGSVSILFQQGDGTFSVVQTRAVGVAPTDVTFADVDGRDGLDILVCNRSTGDVTVLFNDAARTFIRTARYRAGTAVSGLQVVQGTTYTHSREEPVALVAGQFTADARPDVVVVNRGAHRLGTLIGTPGGGFTNPSEALRVGTSSGLSVNDRPGQAVAADFDRDGRPDVAVVMEDRGEVWLYRGGGDGTFALASTTPAGPTPAGLTAADVDGNGSLDLLVGNSFGDVLFVLGNGDGTFRPFVRTDQRVPFVATDLNGDGAFDVVLADQAHDRASAQLRIPGTRAFTPAAFQRDASNGLIGPAAVAVADLDGRHGTDLVFANTGSNNVLVYLRQADGGFAAQPLSYFAGTSPAALHVADLNGDGRADLAVANQGSNDVSILLGSQDAAGGWALRYGPRLQTGGAGPNAVTARDMTGDGIADLLVTNGYSGTLATIPGIGAAGTGTGFFDDGNLTTRVLTAGPVRQTQVVSAALGFALTPQGEVMRFDPGTGAVASAFFDREVNAFRALVVAGREFPVLFTANADGSVSLLTSGDGQGWSELHWVADAGLTNPSALEVLEADHDLFEVYLTDTGDSQPIVLTIDVRAELVVVGQLPGVVVVTVVVAEPPPRPTSTEGVETFNPLTTGLVTAVDSPAGADGPEGEERVVPLGERLLTGVGFAPAVGGAEEALEEVAPAETEAAETPTLQQFITGMQEALERLDLGEMPEGWREAPPDVSPTSPTPVESILESRSDLGRAAPVNSRQGVEVPPPAPDRDFQEGELPASQEPPWTERKTAIIHALAALVAAGCVRCSRQTGKRSG